jgi:hypothetical protein
MVNMIIVSVSRRINWKQDTNRNSTNTYSSDNMTDLIILMINSCDDHTSQDVEFLCCKE